MKIRTALTALFVTQALPTHAADVCETIRAAYEDASKMQSLNSASGLFKSIKNENDFSDRLNEINELLVQQMNLSLLIANKCPLPEGISVAEYSGAAFKCEQARDKTPKDPKVDDLNLPECDRSTWKKESKSVR